MRARMAPSILWTLHVNARLLPLVVRDLMPIREEHPTFVVF